MQEKNKPINKTSAVKAVGVLKNSKKWIDNPKKLEEFARSEDPNLRTINELKDWKKYQDSTNIHHPSYGTYKEHTVGTTAHRKKYPERYGTHYTSKLEQAAYPKAGTAPSEKIINDYGSVKYDKNGYPDKASPAQVGAMAEKFEEMRQMTGSDGRHDKPKSKKINAYADVKIPIPVIDHSLLRDSAADKARAAALEKTRVYAFSKIPDPDAVRGIGSFTNTIGEELRANNSKSDWEKRVNYKYKDNSNAKK